MEQLLEDYKRRLVNIKKEIDKGFICDAVRLKTKASCYRTFIAELEREIAKSKPENIDDNTIGYSGGL